MHCFGPRAATVHSAASSGLTAAHQATLVPRAQREELVKSGGVQLLSAALECGDADARYAAMGSLAALLAADDRWLSEVASGPPAPLARMLSAAAAMAAGHHDRSRLEAAGLLACAARVPELAARVWGSAAPALAAALLREPPPGGVAAATAGTPGWAGQRRLQRAAGLALKALLEPSEWEPDAVRAVRRREVLRMVGLGPLLALAAGLAGSSGRRSSGGGSDNGDCDSGSGRGAPHAELQLAAAAILRFVVLVPEAAQEVAGGRCCCSLLVLGPRAAASGSVLRPLCARYALIASTLLLTCPTTRGPVPGPIPRRGAVDPVAPSWDPQ